MTWIPVHSVAWRVNAFSALCGALSVSFLGASVYRLTKRMSAAALAAGFFALNPVVWEYATTAEVFALNHLILALMIWIGTDLSELPPEGKPAAIWKFRALFLLAGLGVSNHHTSVFVSVPFLIWAWKRLHPSSTSPKAESLPGLLIAFLIGLLPYLYLPVSAHWNPSALAWGDLRSFEGLVRHFLRSEYGTFSLVTGDAAGKVAKVSHNFALHAAYARHVFQTLGVAGSALAFLGLGDRRGQGLPRWLLLSWIAHLAIFHSLVNLSPDDPAQLSVIERFWQEADLLLCVGIGIGFARVLDWMPRRESLLRWVSVGLVVLGLLPLLGEGLFPRLEKNRTVLATYGRAVLESLPPRALVLVRGDVQANVLNYFQRCENVRPDVRVLETELMTYTWYGRRAPSEVRFPGWSYDPGSGSGYLLGEWLDLQKDIESDSRIFLLGRLRGSDRSYEKNYRLVPNSVFQEVVQKSEEKSPAPVVPAFGDLGSIFHLLQYAPGSWEYPVLQEIRAAAQSEQKPILPRKPGK